MLGLIQVLGLLDECKSSQSSIDVHNILTIKVENPTFEIPLKSKKSNQNDEEILKEN